MSARPLHWPGIIALIATLAGGQAAAEPENIPLYLIPDDRRPIAETVAGALWHDAEWGWIITDDAAVAAQAAEDLRAAVAAFHAHFGQTPERGAILQSRYGGLFQPLKAAGLSWQVPWQFAQTAPDRDGHHGDARSALRHEVAHALFLALIIPSTRKGQYGGDAPDWLDEAAAMIAETPEGAAARRRAFGELVRAGRMKPLSAFVASQHPLFESPAIKSAIEAAKASNPQSPVVLSFRASEIGMDSDAAADFYAQSHAMFDFLHQRTGDRRILAMIAQDFLATRDPLSWIDLVEKGRSRPQAIQDIDDAFRSWSETEYGAGE